MGNLGLAGGTSSLGALLRALVGQAEQAAHRLLAAQVPVAITRHLVGRPAQ